MFKQYIKIIFVLVFLFFLVSPCAVLANSNTLGLDYANDLGLSDASVKDPRIIAVNVVKFLLSFLGLIAVVMVMYAGFLWMTSEGDLAKVDRAKKTLINATIGIVVIFSSFTIVLYIQNLIEDGLPGRGGSGGGSVGALSGGLSASGNQVVEAHYPERGQVDVPRNTKLVITFREAMQEDTLISREADGTHVMNTDNVLVAIEAEISDCSADPGGALCVADWLATSTPDGRTFVFTQNPPYMGSVSQNIWYSVRLQDISRANGNQAFALGQYYDWRFQVGTEIDVTPPTVRSIIPQPDTAKPRNVVVQINFSEGIDPSLASGAYNPPGQNFANIVVTNTTDSDQLAGIFYVSNRYRTVEFLTNEICGTNSCGDTVYCLPGNRDISVRVNAASLLTGLLGLADMAGNSLDGNKDGDSDGPEAESALSPYNENAPDAATQGDDYIWSFQTTNEINISAPSIISIDPGINETFVSLSARPRIVFDKLISASTVNKSSVLLYADPSTAEVDYSLSVNNNQSAEESTLVIGHEEFYEDSQYIPECNSGIKDIYQNCFRPGGTDGGGEGPDGLSGTCTPSPYCCSGSVSAIPCSGIAPAVCDGVACETGECASGCTDCTPAQCCGREGCNPAFSEDDPASPNYCAADCAALPPPPIP